MATQITNYQCPACTGPLQFSSASGMLECEYCESKFTVAEVEALYADKDKKAAEAFAKEEQENASQPEENTEPDIPSEQTAWDTSDISDDWGEDSGRMKAYVCPSCGAELICDDSTAAASCPYCGNNTIVPGQFAGVLKPDVILPFMLDKKAAVDALKSHYKGKWLLPKAFSEENHLNEIQGVYVPFWLYDAQVDVDARFRGVNTLITRTEEYEIIHTDSYDVHRRGAMEFTKVPVDGSQKMDDAYMDSLEPYDYSQLKPFSTAYLPGFLADRYDQSADECARRADSRCERSAVAALRATVMGYQEVHDSGQSVHIKRGKVHYALLPVWVLHTKWQNKDYLFMMNGQTGKFVGDLPVDKKKSALATAALTFVLAALLMLTNIGPGIAAMLMGNG